MTLSVALVIERCPVVATTAARCRCRRRRRREVAEITPIVGRRCCRRRAPTRGRRAKTCPPSRRWGQKPAAGCLRLRRLLWVARRCGGGRELRSQHISSAHQRKKVGVGGGHSHCTFPPMLTLIVCPAFSDKSSFGPVSTLPAAAASSRSFSPEACLPQISPRPQLRQRGAGGLDGSCALTGGNPAEKH